MSQAIGVQLETERGEVVDRLSEHQDLMALIVGYAQAEGSFRILRYVDPYGLTLFNELQMPDLLTDWERITAHYTNPEFADVLARVRELAERCQGRRLYLRFIGD